MREEVVAKVMRWLQEVVIGLGFCPFAAEPWAKGTVAIVVSEATGDDGDARAIQDTLAEAVELLALDEAVRSTTLVVFPNALASFEAFLDVAVEVEGALEVAGAAGVLQVASFHPDYQFEGVEPDALSNFTNRAPFPILHLLRESQVTRAVDAHPHAAAIPAINIARLEKMGRVQVDALWRRIHEARSE